MWETSACDPVHRGGDGRHCPLMQARVQNPFFLLYIVKFLRLSFNSDCSLLDVAYLGTASVLVNKGRNREEADFCSRTLLELKNRTKHRIHQHNNKSRAISFVLLIYIIVLLSCKTVVTFLQEDTETQTLQVSPSIKQVFVSVTWYF